MGRSRALLCGRLLIVWLVLMPYSGVAPVLAGTHQDVWQGQVTYISDGDTLWVRPHPGGAPRNVRLDGIDAPELCQVHGGSARTALTGLVLGQTVQVQVLGHDDYGRILGRVLLQGLDIGAWMVERGHAWSYRYRGQAGPYAKQESLARASRLGLFAQEWPEPPRDFRRRHGSCH